MHSAAVLRQGGRVVVRPATLCPLHRCRKQGGERSLALRVSRITLVQIKHTRGAVLATLTQVETERTDIEPREGREDAAEIAHDCFHGERE